MTEYISEKAKTNVVIDKTKNIPHIKVEMYATFDKSSFLFNNGEIKNKKNSPLNAKILLAPVKKIVDAPSAKIGRERSTLSKFATKINVNNMLNRAIGTIMVLVFIIDFLPIKFATTTVNRKRKIINEIG